ncbi:hypothetical protein SNEBB_009413, partial [Seison nebaliae]
MDSALRQRASLQGWLTRSINKMTAYLDEDEPDPATIEVALEEMNKRTQSLEVGHANVTKLSNSVEAAVASNDDVSDILENAFALKIMAKKVLAKSQKPAAPPQADPAVVPDFMLPRFSMKFNGDRLKYGEFIDAFNEEVGCKDKMPASTKMRLLKSAMIGEAERALEGFDRTEKSYKEALEYLEVRFGDPDERKEALMARLLDLEKCETENCEKMRLLLDTAQTSIRSLNSLGIDKATFKVMFKLILIRKIPESCRRDWHRSAEKKASDDAEGLINFLMAEVRIWEKAKGYVEKDREPSSSSGEKRSSPRDGNKKTKMEKRTILGTTVSNCVFCDTDAEHSSLNCSMSVSQKYESAKKKQLCFLCLKKGHASFRCRSGFKCPKCDGMHNLALHDDAPPRDKGSKIASSKSQVPSEDAKEPRLSMMTINGGGNVLLPIVSVDVHGSKGVVRVRCLLDSGSSDTFVTQELSDLVGLQKIEKKKKFQLTTVSDENEEIDSSVVRCEVMKLNGGVFNMNAYTLPKLNISQKKLNRNDSISQQLQARGITPGDDYEGEGDCSQRVHMIIGSDVFHQVVLKTKVISMNGLAALSTIFGVGLHGPIGGDGPSGSFSLATCLKTKTEDLNARVEAFFELESAGKGKSADVDSEWETLSCVENFAREIKFENDRYEVPLLWKGTERPTPNGHVVKSMFEKMKSRLEKTSSWDKYSEVFDEYTEVGAIEDDSKSSLGEGHFVPHHAVFRPESETHPVRVVFNASFKRKGEVSLNECLNTGPNLLPHAASILLRFRKDTVGVTADLSKAFFSMSVKEDDRKYLRLVWEGNTLVRMARVPFGVNCSP